ncbi:MAG: ribonuclease PH [Brockia lithotrophica]|nr:ribonuclease PH [Brockia lithotrophica]
MRIDGRSPDELRPVRLTPHVNKYAEGSVLIEVGDTRVYVTATVEDKVPPFLRGQGRGWVTAEYSLLPRSTETRTQRESVRGHLQGRTMEIQRLIGRALRAVVDPERLGERTVIVDADVLQADGGTRTAAITGGFVALALAFERLRERGEIAEIPLVDFLAATSVGVVGDVPLLDLNFAEDSEARVDMNIAMTGSGRFVEIQGSGEGSPFRRAELEELLSLAERGIRRLVEIEREVLGPIGERIADLARRAPEAGDRAFDEQGPFVAPEGPPAEGGASEDGGPS